MNPPLDIATWEKLPRNEKIFLMHRWGMKGTEIAEHYYLTKQRVGAIIAKMGKGIKADMKTCDFQGEQEKCPNYEMKNEKTKNFTCLCYRQHWPEDDSNMCDQEFKPKTKPKEKAK